MHRTTPLMPLRLRSSRRDPQANRGEIALRVFRACGVLCPRPLEAGVPFGDLLACSGRAPVAATLVMTSYTSSEPRTRRARRPDPEPEAPHEAKHGATPASRA